MYIIEPILYFKNNVKIKILNLIILYVILFLQIIENNILFFFDWNFRICFFLNCFIKSVSL